MPLRVIIIANFFLYLNSFAFVYNHHINLIKGAKASSWLHRCSPTTKIASLCVPDLPSPSSAAPLTLKDFLILLSNSFVIFLLSLQIIAIFYLVLSLSLSLSFPSLVWGKVRRGFLLDIWRLTYMGPVASFTATKIVLLPDQIAWWHHSVFWYWDWVPDLMKTVNSYFRTTIFFWIIRMESITIIKGTIKESSFWKLIRRKIHKW